MGAFKTLAERAGIQGEAPPEELPERSVELCGWTFRLVDQSKPKEGPGRRAGRQRLSEGPAALLARGLRVLIQPKYPVNCRTREFGMSRKWERGISLAGGSSPLTGLVP